MNNIPDNELYAYIYASLDHDESLQLLKVRYSAILADLVSASTNPTCACRGRVLSYVSGKYQEQEEKDFLNKIFYTEQVKTKAEFTITENKNRAANTLGGKILTIVKKNDYWKDFHSSISRSNYRSFSIVDKGDSIDVYFL